MVSSTPATTRGRTSAWLYALTILISAFLVFQVQPIISKSILPWFGGSPAVWTTCMLFFQVLLFAGYVYAHLLSKLRPLWQVVVHVTLIYSAALLLLILPITPEESWKADSGSNPTITILLLLFASVGLPYFLLASTGPLVQSWFTRSFQNTPYRLYALSNAGSLTALITYPFLFEPTMSTQTQGAIWSLGFVLFALCCGYCAIRSRRLGEEADKESSSGQMADGSSWTVVEPTSRGQDVPSWPTCLTWLLLAGLASMMLLATTNHVCQDVAVIPFLWVAPLSLYLLSFIICFDKEAWYSPRWYGLGTLFSVTAISILYLWGDLPRLSVEVGIHFIALFCVCMICHGELVRRKPDPRHLTLFYLMCSAGGALGGIFVAIICPNVFTGFFEMNIGLVIVYMMATGVSFAAVENQRWWQDRRFNFAAKLAVFLGFLCVVRAQAMAITDSGFVATRNFYGVIRLREEESDQPERQGRYMFHGRIAHGFQFRDPKKRRIPTMYYDKDSGLAIALQNYPRSGSMRIGVIGLGTGTIATFGQPGDYIRFYEINPEVYRLASDYFTFLDDSLAEVDVIIGDARLSMEREPPQQFDVLVLDAFSGDAIPAHLLTKEAFDEYRRHLKPDGTIVANISNRHVDLVPVLTRLTEHNRMESLQFLVDFDSERFRAASHWYVMSNNRRFLDNEVVRAAAHGDLGTYARIPMWTDQYNNLFRVLK